MDIVLRARKVELQQCEVTRIHGQETEVKAGGSFTFFLLFKPGP